MSDKHPFGTPNPPSAALQCDFGLALEHHRSGRTADAERVCQSILVRDPANFDASLLLGLILLQSGRVEAAERQIATAVRVRPDMAAAHRHHGVALARLGRLPDALASFDRAVALKSDFAEAFNNRGSVLHQMRRFDEALASFDRAIALKPDYAEAFNNRGNLLQDMQRSVEAIASYDRAIALKPDAADAIFNRAVGLQALGRLEDALAGYDRAIALKPQLPDAYNNRGNVLRELGRLDAALSSYDRAMALQPDSAEAAYNRGLALLDLKRTDEALAGYARALALRPDYPEARFSRGLCKLLLGQFRDAWDDFECRWQIPVVASPRPDVNAPEWTDENAAGKSILVYSERGFGDIIHFSRYLPLLAERGAMVSFLVPQKLAALMRTLPDGIRFVHAVEPDARFDYQCALMSLPHRFKTEIDSIPARVPYLKADPARAAQWHAKLDPRGFKIGVSWQGAPWQGGTAIRGRSFPLAALEPLAHIASVRLISLQKNDGIEQLASLPAAMAVETLGDFDNGADAFADTAAIMETLDLVITCDTSIAHLAGALARPCWVALKHVPEWRWMLDRADSPWYPTLRLFRQTRDGDWQGVFARMAPDLEQFVRTKTN